MSGAQRRLFKARFAYKLRTRGSVLDGAQRTARVQVEERTMKRALPKLEAAARRQCRIIGDEIFVRLTRVTDKGEIDS
jgi:hypothetical protein